MLSTVAIHFVGVSLPHEAILPEVPSFLKLKYDHSNVMIMSE